MAWCGLIAATGIALAGAAAENAGLQVADRERTILFFDWGKVTLNSDSRAQLDELAAEWRATPPKRIEVTGFSDRSGAPGANLRASQRRADAVAAYLAGAGLPAQLISTSARGEGEPLIPTEDGVREVQNRRVEVVVRR